MARLRATVNSQAPGRAGLPSAGQRCDARAKASWAQSSARSQSPNWWIRAATVRPHSSRKAPASAGPLSPSERLKTAAPPRHSPSCIPPQAHAPPAQVDAGVDGPVDPGRRGGLSAPSPGLPAARLRRPAGTAGSPPPQCPPAAATLAALLVLSVLPRALRKPSLRRRLCATALRTSARASASSPMRWSAARCSAALRPCSRR